MTAPARDRAGLRLRVFGLAFRVTVDTAVVIDVHYFLPRSIREAPVQRRQISVFLPEMAGGTVLPGW